MPGHQSAPKKTAWVLLGDQGRTGIELAEIDLEEYTVEEGRGLPKVPGIDRDWVILKVLGDKESVLPDTLKKLRILLKIDCDHFPRMLADFVNACVSAEQSARKLDLL